MRTVLTCAAALSAVAPALASLGARDSVTANVYLGNNTGEPQHLASGLLYGVPDQANQVQDHWYKDMGFNYLRAGGAQLAAPARGWIWGMNEYKNRFASALSNYRTARQHGAKFVFLIHDLWGADGTQNSTAPYPGDNGDWTFWDQYFAQLVSDMQSNSMIEDVIIDIWNEPDYGSFWGRDQSQYLRYWGRAYYQFRGVFGSDMLLSGPASAGEPGLGNGWWTNWADYVASNGSVPDQYVWHMEGGGGNMIESTNNLNDVLARYNLPSRPININEYAVFNEQVPAGSAWWISQLERVNAIGLRGNWLSGNQLHDFLASLLSKPGAQDSSYDYTANNYYPNGDYQVYKFYNMNMTGHRVSTLPSNDGLLDCYATVGSDKVRVMVGVRIRTGTWTLQLNGLSKVGLPASGTLNVHTLGFPASLNTHYGEVDGPVDLGVYGHPYSGDSVSFPIFQTDSTTAYVFEFDIPSSGTTTTTTTTSTTTSTSSTSSSASTTTSTSATTTSTSATTVSTSATTVSTSETTASTSATTASTSATTASTSVTTTNAGSSSTTSVTTTTLGTTTLLSSTTSMTTTLLTSLTSSTTLASTSGTSETTYTTTTGSGSSTLATTSGTISTTTKAITSSVSTTLTSGSTASTSTSKGTTSTTVITTSVTSTSTSSVLPSTTLATSTTLQGSSTTSRSGFLTTTTTKSIGSTTVSGQGQEWTTWATWSSTTSAGPGWSPIATSRLPNKTITLTQTYVVPCATGLTTLTKTMTTTHCGCSETPVPTVLMTVTIITPKSGWAITTPYTATVPVEAATTNNPAAGSMTNVWSAIPGNGKPVAATSNSWAAVAPTATAGTLSSAPIANWNGGNSVVAAYTGDAAGINMSFFSVLVMMGITIVLI